MFSLSQLTRIHVFRFTSYLKKYSFGRIGYDGVIQESVPLEVLWVELCNFWFISYDNFNFNSFIFPNWVLSQIIVSKYRIFLEQ